MIPYSDLPVVPLAPSVPVRTRYATGFVTVRPWRDDFCAQWWDVADSDGRIHPVDALLLRVDLHNPQGLGYAIRLLHLRGDDPVVGRWLTDATVLGDLLAVMRALASVSSRL